MSTPPGWFPNPANSDEEVYWDGDKWSGDTRPVYRSADANSEVAATDAGQPKTDSTDGSDLSAESSLPPRKKRTRLWIGLAVVAAVLVAGGVTTAVVMNNIHTQQVAEQQAAAKKKAEQDAKEAAAAAKAAADEAQRAQRASTITQVEGSIKKMAEDDIATGVLVGPVIAVKCNPVSGSTDDLTDATTSFDCFVSNKDNGDGTQSGYFFNATVNWTTGEYTYGLGKSGS